VSNPLSSITPRDQTRSVSSSVLLAILVLVVTVNFMDRTIVSTIGVAIKNDLGLSDTQLGLLQGLAFALFYTTLGIPMARLADRHHRVNLMSAAIAIWSSFTFFCGFAQNYLQLLLFRIGVGVGESGCNPPLQSILADYFPPEKRTSAISIVSCGIPLGILIGAVGGGIFTDHLGWRGAFLILGVPGLLLALIVKLFVPEPVRGQLDSAPSEADGSDQVPSIGAVIKALWENSSFRWMLAGTSLASLSFTAITSFGAVHFIRSFELSFTEVGFLLGLVVGCSQAVGILSGGFLTEWLSLRSYRWLALAPGIGLAISAPLGIATFMQTDLHVAVALFFLSGLFHFYLAPTVAVMHNILRPRMRATGMAIILLLINLVGTGLGPLIAGMLIDFLAGPDPSAEQLAEPTAIALSFLAGIPAISGALFWIGSRSLSRF